MGGRLIRELLRFCREFRLPLGLSNDNSQILQRRDSQPTPKPRAQPAEAVAKTPTGASPEGLSSEDQRLFQSRFIVACSGGSDSLALLVLLARYGRRLVEPSRLEVLHINHRWRGSESDADAAFVEATAKKLGLVFHCADLDPALKPRRTSAEAFAHSERAAIYSNWTARGCYVLTAHTADDLAETVLWKLCTARSADHASGIRVQHAGILRPFLFARKEVLKAFLKEEGLDWREDSTNHDGKYLRSQMRQRLMPELERVFPRAVDRLAGAALRNQLPGR